jgi:hypothetical protein
MRLRDGAFLIFWDGFDYFRQLSLFSRHGLFIFDLILFFLLCVEAGINFSVSGIPRKCAADSDTVQGRAANAGTPSHPSPSVLFLCIYHGTDILRSALNRYSAGDQSPPNSPQATGPIGASRLPERRPERRNNLRSSLVI